MSSRRERQCRWTEGEVDGVLCALRPVVAVSCRTLKFGSCSFVIRLLSLTLRVSWPWLLGGPAMGDSWVTCNFAGNANSWAPPQLTESETLGVGRCFPRSFPDDSTAHLDLKPLVLRNGVFCNARALEVQLSTLVGAQSGPQ